MSLNPLRDASSNAGLSSFHLATPFKAQADVALSSFQSIRSDLERQVRRGDLTIKVAREQAAAAAAQIRDRLLREAEQFSPTPRVFLDRLIAASESRRLARENQSLEALQRETNRLLRLALVEQQLVNRVAEFEGKTFVRPVTGGNPAPTLASLLAFHESANQAGDDAASEWARRQIEGLRSRTFSPDDHHRIDLATDRPDRVNSRIVMRYVESMRGQPCESIETFVREAIDSSDSNACAAAFMLAREAAEGMALRWVRDTLEGLRRFPDAALAALRGWEADARQADVEAARAAAEFTATVAEAEARFPALTPPTPAELLRRDRVSAKPIAEPGEPLGLGLSRRGTLADELRIGAAFENENGTESITPST